jgi:hypothetical protein
MINNIYPDLGANTDTLAFKTAQMKIGFDEAKESIGFALLPIMGNLITFINEQALPTFNAFIAGLTGNEGAVEGLNETETSAYNVGVSINSLAKSIGELAAVFSTDGKSSMEGFITVLKFVAQTATVVVTVIKELISFIIEMANQVISFLNLFGAGIAKINSIRGTAFSAWGSPTGGFATSGTPGAISGGGNGGGASGMGGFSGGAGSGSGAGTSGGGGGGGNANQRALENLINDAATLQDLVDQYTGTGNYSADAIARRNALQNFRQNESVYNITVNGAIDSESTARQIVQILNDSTSRGTLGAGAFDR